MQTDKHYNNLLIRLHLPFTWRIGAGDRLECPGPVDDHPLFIYLNPSSYKTHR